MGAHTYGTHGTKKPKKWMTTEVFEYNNKLSGVKYSQQQPFSNIYYCPDMDATDECYDSQIQIFHNIIGILRWTV